MQLSHDYALKITFTKRQGLSGSPFEAYKFSHQGHGLNKKKPAKCLYWQACALLIARL